MFKHIAVKNICLLMYKIPKMYSQPYALYFVEPYNEQLEQLKNDFLKALDKNNKSECFDILKNIEMTVIELTPKIGIISSKLETNKIFNLIELVIPVSVKSEFDFMKRKQKQIRLIKLLTQYYFNSML